MRFSKVFLFSAFCFTPLFAMAYSCNDGIPYCKQMDSCEQARFYLNQCGADKLDRDNDGIPCENICGKGGKKAKGKKSKSSTGTKKRKKKSGLL